MINQNKNPLILFFRGVDFQSQLKKRDICWFAVITSTVAAPTKIKLAKNLNGDTNNGLIERCS